MLVAERPKPPFGALLLLLAKLHCLPGASPRPGLCPAPDADAAMNRLRMGCAVLGAIGSLALNGCGPAGAESGPAVPLATVNGVAIRLAEPSAAPVDKAHVDFLIDTQLLQEAAIAHQLDRDPLVRQSIARANTAILAQAYLQSKAGALPAPTRAEIDAYLAQQPDTFSLPHQVRDRTVRARQQTLHAAAQAAGRPALLARTGGQVARCAFGAVCARAWPATAPNSKRRCWPA
ncbi:hypothetical protein LP419_06515 [Massilia sp. H-1]|nr:hypothetical protein LP419_06515 [Massilia sp. H-1]